MSACAVVGAVLGTLALAGCSGGGAASPSASAGGDHAWTPTTSASSSPSAAPDPLETKYGRAPLDAFLASKADSDAQAAARNILITQCMKEKGFGYQPTDNGTVSQAPASRQWSDFLGITDMARAKTVGYQPEGIDLAGEKAKAALSTAPPATPSADPSGKAYQDALIGNTNDPASSDTGCSGKVDAQLVAPKGDVDVSIQGELALQASQAAQADAAVQSAVKAWSTCMAGKGYQASTPMDVYKTVDPLADPTQATIDEAVTDVGCKQSSGLSDTYIQALYREQKSLIDSHRSQLDAYSAWLKKNADLARAVVAGK